MFACSKRNAERRCAVRQRGSHGRAIRGACAFHRFATGDTLLDETSNRGEATAMADAWTEQQLMHFIRIRDGLRKTGFSEEAAETHAAYTVEQARRRPRRVPDPTNPTKDQLYHEAKRYDIAGRSAMDKEQLANAVRQHRNADRGGR
jgi:hypothetical protein